MKLALAFAFVAISIAVASASLSCILDEKKCPEEECCIKITNLIGRCAKLKKEDERCEMKPGKMVLKKHVYLRSCPCAAGMKCNAKDGLIGKIMGTCQHDSSEVVDPETPEPEIVETEAPEPEEPEPEEPEPEEPEPEEE